MSEVEQLRAEVEQLRVENRELVESLDRIAVERDTFKTERGELRAEVSDSSRLIWKQAQLLTGVVNAVRGKPGPLELHSHHDAAELVQAVVAERDALSARLQAVRDTVESWPDGNERASAYAAARGQCKRAVLAALDASLGTPGDETGEQWARLCDERGMTEYRRPGNPYPCTGSMHLGPDEVVRCDNPIHKKPQCEECSGTGVLWDVTGNGALSRPCPCGSNPLVLRNSPVESSGEPS